MKVNSLIWIIYRFWRGKKSPIWLRHFLFWAQKLLQFLFLSHPLCSHSAWTHTATQIHSFVFSPWIYVKPKRYASLSWNTRAVESILGKFNTPTWSGELFQKCSNFYFRQVMIFKVTRVALRTFSLWDLFSRVLIFYYEMLHRKYSSRWRKSCLLVC
jgi:hypothetical protein